MNTILSNKLDEIQKICQTYKVKNLYAFGSVCNNTFHSDSDIDLLVSFHSIPIKEYTDNYFTLHSIFEKLFGRSVDLITENSLSNPYFIESIQKSKKILYGT